MSIKMLNVPNIVRIKRKITEDPLQTLVLQNNTSVRQYKKFKVSSFVFKLRRTDSSEFMENSQASSILQKDADSSSSFIIPHSKASQKTVADDTELNKEEDFKDVHPELADMVMEYLQLEQKENTVKKDPSYVYDVYFRDNSSVGDIALENESNIGFIKFADEDLQLLDDEENSNDSDFPQLSDDEDSNAEDFYRNDYPENEDDDKGIVIADDEEEWYEHDQNAYDANDRIKNLLVYGDEEEVERVKHNSEEEDENSFDYYGKKDNENDIAERLQRRFQDEEYFDHLRKENKAFNKLSLDEVDYLYNEYYNNEKKKSMINDPDYDK